MDEKAPWKQGQPIFPRLWFTLGQHFNFSISSWNLLLHFLVENKYFEIENLILLILCDEIHQTSKCWSAKIQHFNFYLDFFYC